MNYSIRQFLKQRVRPSLNSIANGNQIIMLGDDHNMNKGRIWLEKEIRNGISDINSMALEYFETDKQQLIDKFDKKKIVSYLKRTYKDFPGFDAISVIKFIECLKTAKWKIKGVEMPKTSFIDWKDKNNQNIRSKYISAQILKLSGNNKCLVLLGADHVEKKLNNVYGLLKRNKKAILSIIFIGGKNWTIDTNDYWIRKLENDIKSEGLENEMFSLKTNTIRLPCDWIIHFPQT